MVKRLTETEHEHVTSELNYKELYDLFSGYWADLREMIFDAKKELPNIEQEEEKAYQLWLNADEDTLDYDDIEKEMHDWENLKDLVYIISKIKLSEDD